MSSELIRNFAIIAHIDHGKSTLADRLLEFTGAVGERDQRDQFLDNMDLERERGITIKAQTVRLSYTARDGQTYRLNLIDTPGHVDFNYEVSRSLAACEGVLLIVDAAQGVEAQTLANVYLAFDNELEIIPVLNKIDLPAADVERVKSEIEDIIGLDTSNALLISAKAGIGIEDVLEAVIERIPPPTVVPGATTRALVIDSWFDPYRGVIALVRVVDGALHRGQKIALMATGATSEISELAVNAPFPLAVERLEAGEVGMVISMMKDLGDVQTGDTITVAKNGATEPLKGFKEVKPMVFAGVYPTDSRDYENLRNALGKLKLNDASLSFEPETSVALGFGFRCGFLGLLHMEIIQERLEREFEMAIITTAPTTLYHIYHTQTAPRNAGTMLAIHSPSLMPSPEHIERIEEPYIRATIHTPDTYLGAIIALCQERRGVQNSLTYVNPSRVMLEYELPLAEVLFDFFDRLKSCSRGYASLDYEVSGYQPGDLVKLDVLVNGESVDALSVIVHRDTAFHRGKALVLRLTKLIPRHQFEIPLQAAVGSRIIARETIRAMRKNVTAKCYGGDISRKRKLLQKQKAGKKRMKSIGAVDVPQEAFLAVLSVGDD